MAFGNGYERGLSIFKGISFYICPFNERPYKIAPGQIRFMKKIELEIVALSHSITQTHSYAVVLGEINGLRRLPIVIGGFEAQAIAVALEKMHPSRPLTHDLINNIFNGFGITVERVIITELKNSTYYARLILEQANELGRKIVEIDARPSDCLAIATAQKRPLYVTTALFNQVEDMSKLLEEINENGSEPE